MENRRKIYANSGKIRPSELQKRIFMNFYLYIQNRYAKISMVALYPSQRPPVSKKGLKIL